LLFTSCLSMVLIQKMNYKGDIHERLKTVISMLTW
jgi:predicted transcriptional regulator